MEFYINTHTYTHTHKILKRICTERGIIILDTPAVNTEI